MTWNWNKNRFPTQRQTHTHTHRTIKFLVFVGFSVKPQRKSLWVAFASFKLHREKETNNRNFVSGCKWNRMAKCSQSSTIIKLRPGKWQATDLAMHCYVTVYKHTGSMQLQSQLFPTKLFPLFCSTLNYSYFRNGKQQKVGNARNWQSRFSLHHSELKWREKMMVVKLLIHTNSVFCSQKMSFAISFNKNKMVELTKFLLEFALSL